MSSRASEKPSKYVCPDCGRAYKAAETMNRHRKNHSDTTSFACTICNASFKRKDLLDRHSQIHVNGRPVTRRNRSQRACDRCSRLKTRCDNLSPCTRCSGGGHECTYKHVRSRARTDRSSASTTSSAHGSPQMTAEELNTLVGEYCSSPEVASLPGPSAGNADHGWTESFWLQDSSWPWPELDPNLRFRDFHATKPSRNSPRMLGDDKERQTVLDPTLNTSMSSIPASLCQDIDQTTAANIIWNPEPPAFPHQSHNFYHWNDLRPDSPCRQASEQRPPPQNIISELALYSTTALSTGVPHSHWIQTSTRIEQAFGLSNIFPPNNTGHLLQHCHALFFKFFPSSFPAQPTDAFNNTLYPPHLYLVMAAIGATYLPNSHGLSLSTALLSALRPRLIAAAIQEHLTSMQVHALIQSLALLQAALLHFASREAFDHSPQIAKILVMLARRVSLFTDDNWERRRVACGIVKLDGFVRLLLGGDAHVTEMERCACEGVMERDGEIWEGLLNLGARLAPESGPAGGGVGSAGAPDYGVRGGQGVGASSASISGCEGWWESD